MTLPWIEVPDECFIKRKDFWELVQSAYKELTVCDFRSFINKTLKSPFPKVGAEVWLYDTNEYGIIVGKGTMNTTYRVLTDNFYPSDYFKLTERYYNIWKGAKSPASETIPTDLWLYVM